MALLLIRKYIRKNKEIDERLKQRLQEIHTILSERTISAGSAHTGITEYTEAVDSTKLITPNQAGAQLLATEPTESLPEVNETVKNNQPEEQIPVKVKKTRQMSMEERWADYEAKRAAQRKTA